MTARERALAHTTLLRTNHYCAQNFATQCSNHAQYNAFNTVFVLTAETDKAETITNGADLEGKPLGEDVITQEAASKSVHVLGQGVSYLPTPP